MNDKGLVDQWWQQEGAGDQSIEDSHAEFWSDFLANAIDVDFTGTKILDFGCNQGGFLRRVYETMAFRKAVGVDLAQKSMAQANARKQQLPVEYFALDTLDTLDKDFDYAVSTSVIYLIDDVARHASEIFERLKPGGVYFAGYEDYVSEPRYKFTQDAINEFASIRCAQNSLNDVIRAFESTRFKVFVKRLVPLAYIPVPVSANNRWYATAKDEIDYWYEHRYCLRCVKP